MTYKFIFIYNREKINNILLYGCLGLKINKSNNEIEKYKITFQKVLPSQNIEDYWEWIKNNNFEHYFLWEETLESLNSKINFDSISKNLNSYLNIFNGLFKKEIENISLKEGIPSYCFLNSNDIYYKLKEQLSREPSITEIEIAKKWALIKTVIFFEKFPEKTFDFPLYLEYINNNPKIFEENPGYSVEDFILETSNSISFIENID